MSKLVSSALLLSLGFAGFALAQSADSAPAPAFSVGSGIDYSRGDYGFPTKTEVTSFPLDLGYDAGSWTWRASFSYLTIKGPATVVGGGATPRPTANSESGVGDIYLSGTYRAGPVLGPVNLDATVRVKLPTANENRGLGTGETDVYGELTAHRTFGSTTPFVTVGYREFGDSALYPLEGGAYGSVGAHFRTSPATVVTAALDWGQKLIAGGDDTSDALLAVTHDINPSWRVMGYAMTGFSDASPDFGGGLRLTYRF
jgi:hypothetical protein